MIAGHLPVTAVISNLQAARSGRQVVATVLKRRHIRQVLQIDQTGIMNVKKQLFAAFQI